MTLADVFSKMTLSQKDAEVIFDRDEPVGRPTDVVMPAPRRLRRKSRRGSSAKRSAETQSPNP